MSSSRCTNPAANKPLLTHLAVAGTAALAASNAGAQIVVTPVNVDVGFGPGGQSVFTSSLPDIAQFHILRITGARGEHFVSATGGLAANNYLVFHTTRTANRLHQLIKSPAGQKFGSAPGTISSSAGFAAATHTVGGGTRHRGNAPFTGGYFLFKFHDSANGNHVDYGYINASLTDNSFNGLNVHINSYAYDLSGNQIAAGQLPNAVPEPGAAMALAALGALTLGAAGVRRMKALQA